MRSTQDVFNIMIKNGLYNNQVTDRKFMCIVLDNAEKQKIISRSENIIAQEEINNFIGDEYTMFDFLIQKARSYVRSSCLRIYQNWNKRYEILEELKASN